MFILKLNLLTLLMIAPGLLVIAENEITCYGSVQHLSCDTGLINVTSAIYGRTDKSICSVGRPASETQNTACTLNIPIISARCNGYRQCEFKTDTLGSPDPCIGTFKYYNTTYTCTEGRVNVICEDGYSTLDCGNDVIDIINANYGRTDSTTCSKGLPSFILANTNCYASNTLSIVATRCNGKNSCTVRASYTIFNDPCIGTSKYLTVSYRCLPPLRPIYTSVTCEGNNAMLTCVAGVLKILSANYGRTDNTTCSAGRPSNQTTNTNCYGNNTLSEVTRRCKGHSSCVVPATNGVFSDPCDLTYKYLSIKYSCVDLYTSVTCEGNDAVLTCEAGVLNILGANYGRTDSTTCSAGRPISQTTKTDCSGVKTLSEVMKRCGGHSSCVVPATNEVFSDPCYLTYKYLSIKYSCVDH
ncbi:rhamnose-binding lectin-like [Brachyhypopomus gauderio]|uniref:rhamnose-binding lectin-like n=1 Tax=Brachyhypopomus gauderio TaxID=698409 RepID=UPI0040415C17